MTAAETLHQWIDADDVDLVRNRSVKIEPTGSSSADELWVCVLTETTERNTGGAHRLTRDWVGYGSTIAKATAAAAALIDDGATTVEL